MNWRYLVRKPALSLRMRLAVLAVALIGAVVVLAGAGVVLAQGTQLRGSVRAVAQQQLASIRTSVARDGLDGAFARDAAVPGAESSYVQVVDVSGEVLAASPGLRPGQALVATPRSGRIETTTVHGVGGESDAYVAVSQRLGSSSPDADWYVVVARSTESVKEATGSTTRLLLLGIPVVLLAVGLISYRLAGSALAPVDRMRAAVTDFSAVDLSLRVPEPDTHDELARLAETLNDMLARLERSSSQHQQLVADASHELKSPVAALRTLLDVARTAPGTDWDAVSTAALAEVARLQALTSDLLFLARFEQAGQPGAPVDLVKVVQASVTEHRQVEVTFTVAGAPVFDPRAELNPVLVSGNAEALRRLMRNLLDNAAIHATSEIAVSVLSRPGKAVVLVSDDGPGVPPADRERIFERFVRLDDARARDSSGTGLGLAIARQLAVQHGGWLRVVESPGGHPGATFELVLPALAGDVVGPV